MIMIKKKIAEYSLSDFIRKYPAFVPILAPLGVDFSDPDYIVRVDGQGCLEVGYAEDPWTIA